jgi:hypothetical protein
LLTGASPRAAINLTLALFFRAGDYPPEDIKIIEYDVLRHRILYKTEADPIDLIRMI